MPRLISTKNLKHPTLSSFIKENDYFVDGEITDLNYSFLKKIMPFCQFKPLPQKNIKPLHPASLFTKKCTPI